MATLENITAFARRLGVTQPRVSHLVKQGLPMQDGKVAVEDALEWLRARRERHPGSPVARPLPPPPSAAPARPAASAKGVVTHGPASPTASLTDIRRQSEAIRAARNKLKLEAERGEVVERKIVASELFEHGRRQRDAWQGWASRAAPELARVLGADAGMVAANLDRLVRDHLSELAAALDPTPAGAESAP